jgi:hypothetical protein
VSDVLELAYIGGEAPADVKEVQLATFLAVIADRPVPLNHPLVSLLPLSRVVVEVTVPLAVVDIAVTRSLDGVGEEEDVGGLLGGADPTLTTAAVLILELAALDLLAWFEVN